MKIPSSTQHYNFWHSCFRCILYCIIFAATLIGDVSLFYCYDILPVPLSICFYACILATESFFWILLTALSIALLPNGIAIPWYCILIPLLTITICGACLRSCIYQSSIVPYLIVTIYTLTTWILTFYEKSCYFPHFTIYSFFAILIVIKTFSLILSIQSRQGNRV